MTRLSPILLLIATVSVAQAATLISRADDARGIHVAYLVEAEQQPVAVATHGRVTGYTAVQDGAGWRATVTASLDACGGVLTVDGVVLVQQRCVWLPEVVR